MGVLCVVFDAGILRSAGFLLFSIDSREISDIFDTNSTMSTDSSPAHRFAGDYDNFFDPNFTVDVSNRMRVPHKLMVGLDGHGDKPNAMDGAYNEVMKHLNKASIMQVPDRIVVTGQEQNYAGVKAPPRELRLEETIMPLKKDRIRVETPPRTLTLEDRHFPLVGDGCDHGDHNVEANHIEGDHQALVPQTPELNSKGALSNPSDDAVNLRRHLVKLNRRVAILENESQRHQQREMMLYTLGIAYFVLKTLMWLHRHW